MGWGAGAAVNEVSSRGGKKKTKDGAFTHAKEKRVSKY